MAPPTPDEIYDYLTTTLDPRFSAAHTVWEWQELIDIVRGAHNSTTPAIDHRLRALVSDGRIRSVRISNNGYVHDDRIPGIAAPYFNYADSYRPGRGTITLDRPKNHKNPWANGMRHLYMTKPRYEAMITEFTEELARLGEKAKRKRQEECEALRDALTAIVPDATNILKRLEEAVPGLIVEPRRSRNGGALWLSIDSSTTEETVALIAILEKGLKPSEE